MFDELEELELIELIDRKNELLNELEAYNEGLIDLTDNRFQDLNSELAGLYEQIDLIEGME